MYCTCRGPGYDVNPLTAKGEFEQTKKTPKS